MWTYGEYGPEPDSDNTDDCDEGHYFDPDEDPDYDPDELDFARGICRECETWGEFQCRVHADAYAEMQRAEYEHWRLTTLARRGKRTKASRHARARIYFQRIAAEAMSAYETSLFRARVATADAEDIPW